MDEDGRPAGTAGGPSSHPVTSQPMTRIIILAGLLLGLLSCDGQFVNPGGSSDPTVIPPETSSPGRPSPTIEIPPPI